MELMIVLLDLLIRVCQLVQVVNATWLLLRQLLRETHED